MRLAVITDIHGNSFALDAVLASIAGEKVDRTICLGDLAMMGPDPAGAIDRVIELDCPVVRGNTDDLLLNGFPDTFFNRPDGAMFRDIADWSMVELTGRHRAFLDQLAPTVEIDLDGLAICCYHGSPKSYDDPILPDTPVEQLETWFAGVDAPVLIGGHTHRQLLRRWNGRTIVNPGTVSLTYERLPFTDGPNCPWAEYAIVTNNHGDIRIEFRYVPIDFDALFATARQSTMPHVEWWIAGWG